MASLRSEIPLKHPQAILPGMLTPQQNAFSVTWLAYAGFYLCRKNFSVIIPLLAASGTLSRIDLANAVTAYSLTYAIGQFTMGGLADRLGARRVVSLGLFVSFAATVAMGFWYSALALVLLQAVNGLAQASGWPGLVKIMGAWFGKAQRGVVMAWWSTNYAIGGFLATLLATWAVSHPAWLPGLAWRGGLWIPALVLLPVAIWFVIAARERPLLGPAENESGFSLRQVRAVFASPRIQIISAVYFALKLTRYAFLFWLPLYMTERLRYSASEAGYSSALFELAGFFGALSAGYVSDRWMGSRRFPTAALFLALLGLACMLHPLAAEWSRLANLVGIALIGAAIFGPDSLLSGAAVQDAAPAGAVATAAGVVNGLGSFGQLASPWLVLLVAQRYGWDNLFYFFAAISLLSSLLLILAKSEEPGVLVNEAAS